MSAPVTFTLNGQEVEAREGETIWQVASRLGIEIPHPCPSPEPGSRPGGNRDTARVHYRRALELSGGGRAGLHLALAEAVAVPEQDLAAFRDLIEAALAVDLDAYPDQRVANVLAQRRARWLATEIPELFFEASDASGADLAGGLGA